ncbi:MAG TPA: TolC family protein [Kofleriaceae bacterium]|nr:TolC family protein [Kofleriaceae bacterium]
MVCVAAIACAAATAHAQPAPTEVTADQAVALYRAHNLQLVARRATVDVTAADLVDAQIYPNPTLSLGTTNIVQGQDTFGHSQETLGLDVPILIGRQRSHRADAAAARIAARRADVAVDQAAAELEIRRRFVALLAAQERAAARSAALEDARAVRAIVAGRQSAGAKSPYELERTDLALAAAASKRDTAVTEAAVASGALAQAVGIAGWQPRASGPFVPGELAATALAPSHPELAVGVAAEAAARSEQALAHAEAVPTPSLQLQTFGTTDPQGIALTVGVSLPLPVFDRNQGAVARARAQQRAAELEHAATASELSADLVRVLDIERSRRAAVAQFEADAIVRLPRVRAMAEASYRAGQGTIVELLDALDSITEARLHDLELVTAALDAALDVRAAALGR